MRFDARLAQWGEDFFEANIKIYFQMKPALKLFSELMFSI